MNKKLRYFAMLLLMAVTSGAWAQDYYTPENASEIIILNSVYDASKTDDGFSKHAAVKWGGTASTNSKKAGDPDNGGAATSSNVNCFSVKGNGKGKNIDLYVSGLDSMIVYHESNSGRYLQLKEGDNVLATGAKSTYFTKATLDKSKSYVIRLQGTGTGSDQQDFYVYAVTLYKAPATPEITTQPVGAAYATGQTMNPLTVVATASGGDLSYKWYSCDDAEKTNAAEISGATGASYTPTAAGFYYVTVTDANGSVDSDVVEITVEAAEEPVITEVTGIPDAPVAVGTEVTFTATVTGVPTPTVQWYDASTNDAINGETELTFTPDTSTPGTYSFFVRAENDEGYAVSNPIELVVKELVATPAFDPNGSYFEDFEKIFITCETEDATILYSTDNGSTWATYEDGIQVTETTTILAKATKDDCIDSESATATFTKVTLLEQTTISEATTWDWSQYGTKEIKTEGTPFYRSDVLVANVSAYGYTAPATAFGPAQALILKGDFIVRDNKYCQVTHAKFKTTVPGYVSLEFSNTGSNRPYRYVYVNGVPTEFGSNVSGSTTMATNIPVAAGDVDIYGVIDPDCGEEGAGAENFIRIYNLTFTPAETVAISAAGYATYTTTGAIDFTDTGVKAFIVDEATTANVHFAPVTKVPAGTAIVVKGAEGEYTLPATTEDTDDVTANLLKTPTEGQTSTGVNEYCLANKTKGIGFYPVSQGVAIKKAYLEINTANEAPEFIGFIEDGGISTGISTVAVENAELNIDAPMYNIAGQRVSRSYKGVVIQNGKKFIVK